MITPYTSIDVIAITSNKPALMLVSACSGPKGIATQAAKAGMMAMIGPRRNKPGRAAVGMTASWVRRLSAWATDCQRAQTPG